MTNDSTLTDDHPQTASFFLLFPKANTRDCASELEACFQNTWRQFCKTISLSFDGLSAEAPNYDHSQAEYGGNDYSCRIYAHFKNTDATAENVKIFLESFPYPDKNGEFVLKGNRYIFPIYLRTAKQYAKMQKWLRGDKAEELKAPASTDDSENERKTDNLHIVLLHELLKPWLERGLTKILRQATETFKKNSGDYGLISLRGELRNWLKKGNNTLLHSFLFKYGQLLDRSNPLNRLCQRKELSFYGLGGEHPESSGSFHIRDVDDDDIYRICPVVSPQGHKVGMRLYLARRAKITLPEKSLRAPETPGPGDSLSDAASLIPFVEHDDVSRALMGANMMRQALPLEEPDVPWIQTGWEKKLAQSPEFPPSLKPDGCLSLGKNLLAAYLPWGLETFEDGIVISESAAEALASIEEKIFWFNQEKKIPNQGDVHVTQVTKDNPRISAHDKRFLDAEGKVKFGTEVAPGDVLVSAVIKPYRNVHKTKIQDVMLLEKFIGPNLKGAQQEIHDASLRMPPNFKGRVTEIIDLKQKAFAALSTELARRIGFKIQCKEPVKLGDKVSSRHGAKGVVVNIIPDAQMPYLKTKASPCRDGKCPVKESHRHVQIIINPLSVTGRLNLGQLYETTLAKVAEDRNQPFVVNPFNNGWDLDHLAKALAAQGISEDGKEQLYIIEEGSERPLKYRSLAGSQYFLKLHHMAADKIQARPTGQPYDYTFRDNQPRIGKRVRGEHILGSGQKVGEMETWALAGHAAWHLLDDLLNVKSDDRRLLKKIDAVDFNWNESRRPQAFANLVLICRSLALDLQLLSAADDVTDEFLESEDGIPFDSVKISFAKPEKVKAWGLGGEVQSTELYVQKKEDWIPPLNSLYPHPDGLYSRKIFNRAKPWQMGLIQLAEPVLHPMAGYIKGEYDPGDYTIERIPVLPISFRQERFGIYKTYQNDLNVHYRNVIVQNQQLRMLINGQRTKQDQLDIVKKRLNNAIKGLFLGGAVGGKTRGGITNIIKDKQGLIRGHLAGKRADYSGRSVIIGDPSMPLNETGIPDTIWNQLFPGLEKTEKPIILLNRQPSLHRYSIQAFRAAWHPKGDVIRLNPFVCKPFNADFDGDTIALHVPRKPAAITEAEKLLPTRNMLSQANGQMVLGFDKDIALGAAYLTYDPKIETDEKIPLTTESELPLDARDFWERQSINGTETTVGRLLLKRLFGQVPINNRSMDQNAWMNALDNLTKQVAQNNPSVMDNFSRDISKLFGGILKYSGLSLSLKDFQTFPEQQKQEHPSLLGLMRKIGKFDKDLEVQITQMRGEMRRPGKDDEFTEIIQSNLLNGHTERDYFCSAHGARAGLVDKGLITAHSGSLLRDWIYSLQHLYIVQEDCGSSQGLSPDGFDEGQIRFTRFDTEGHLIQNITDGLRFRSPWTCCARDAEGHTGICQKCYGYDPATGKLPDIGLPVGILAAQAIGERVSQETLKSFHTGGTAQTELKKGYSLVKYLRKAISKEIENSSKASAVIQEIFSQFSSGSCPRLIHFEILLKGHNVAYENSLLAKLAKSQPELKLFKLAESNSSDDLYGVIGRIVCGRLIGAGPNGDIYG